MNPPRLRPIAVALGLIAAAMVDTPPALAADSVFKDFVTRRGETLYDGDRPLRFISWNIPNLQNVEDAFTFLGDSPWRWPNDYEIADALQSTKQMGGTVVRTYVLSVKREGSDMGDGVHVLAPGRFNEEAFVTLDRVLAAANERGVRVFVPLVDQWHWMGGIRQYEAFRGKPEDSFWTDPQLIDDFKQTIHYFLNRRNTITGQLYKDDKAIFCWETGNEITSPASWTKQIAAYIKSIDPNHLVMDGRSLRGVPEWSLEDPNVDIVTTHHYPGGKVGIPEVVRRGIAKAAGKKPYLIGEVGFIPNSQMREIYDDVIASKAVGVLGWSLRFRNRDGGFYAHSEPAAGGRYKAYHWPGFPSGDSFDETELLMLMRAKAYEIRGETPPALPRPEPAVLLPIDDVGRIAWRGPTGASGYDLHRATHAEGPWETIAENVSDAAVYYRPLFADMTARPGQSYYYRVVARNASGAAPPSDVVGPVECNARVLVDEMADDSLYAEATGATVRKGNDRLTQEDRDCLTIRPGGSVAYELEEGVDSLTVYLFAEQDDARLTIATGDGDAIAPRRETSGRDAGDYGYLSPVLLTAESVPGAPRRVILSVPVDADEVHLARVEIRYGG